MPRVGSSMISSFGLGRQPLGEHDLLLVAAATACRPASSSAVVLELQPRGPVARPGAFSAPRRISPSRRERAADASASTLRAIERSMTRPCWRRSSGTKPMPGAHRGARARRRAAGRPSTSTWPASARSMPKIARATSLRPAPTSPASPTISPARTSKRDVEEHALAGEAARPRAATLADLGVLLGEQRRRARGRPSGGPSRRSSSRRSARRATYGAVAHHGDACRRARRPRRGGGR